MKYVVFEAILITFTTTKVGNWHKQYVKHTKNNVENCSENWNNCQKLKPILIIDWNANNLADK